MATRTYPPPLYKPIRLRDLQSTDRTRWRLNVDRGRQVWEYLDSTQTAQNRPQTDVERYWLGLPMEKIGASAAAQTPFDAARKGFAFLRNLQTEDGHWAGRYDGPMFITPGVVISLYCVRHALPDPQRFELIRYILSMAHPEDGGWGLHSKGKSIVFGTTLNYVTLRILGVGADEEPMIKARNTLHSLGGAAGIPAWGKFWLSILGVYKWEGMNPIPPELTLLPHILPVHPGRFWAHTRVVYLSMAYLYGKRYVTERTLLTEQLKEEIYVQPFNSIDWAANRANVAEVDMFTRPNALTRLANRCLAGFEQINPTWVRERALEETLSQVLMEEANTSGLGLAPVNYAVNTVALAVGKGKDSFEYRRHIERLPDPMWMSPQGLMVNGTNGSQMWDAGFAAQAAVETGLADLPENHACLARTLEFLDECQIQGNPPYYEVAYRFRTRGAWPFSTHDQGYTVSDCTAEGLQSVLLLQNLPYLPVHVGAQRAMDAVDLLLTMQNPGGGFASYETIRSPEWIEFLNPAEIFGKYMVEYTYPECTTSVILGLKCFQRFYPDYRLDDIRVPVQKGCEFLISKQRADGGWGESFEACETGEYVQYEDSQVVQTAWAMLALMAAQYPGRDDVTRAAKFIMSRQQPNGEWLQESLEGVFNKSCAIAYPNFKLVFTTWALGKYAKLY
ncbi:Lanosterol synthase (Oxidosqualene--lanosterol cyclase), partial [Tieghemiomyces parasiticus]